MTAPKRSVLFYGDNLPILREHIADESVALVYLDPPFNSQRSYNVLFKEETGRESEAQITAFEDTWHWNQSTAEVYEEIVTTSPPRVASMMAALRSFIGTNQMMAYLTMMAVRLIELQRVLKPTGTLYLHCDPTASHYLRVVLDTIFGPDRFINEIIWRRQNAKGLASTRFASDHDVLLMYSKSARRVWRSQYKDYDPDYIREFYKYVDEDTGRRYRLGDLTNPNRDRPNLTYEFLGVTRVWRWTRERMQEAYDRGLVVQTQPGGVPQFKRYLDEQKGTPVDDIWDDIAPIPARAAERLGYPTQKPVALLERIVSASSRPGDVVLDPFCGCGTTIAAAQKLGRCWMGIDITHLSIALMKYRLSDMFDLAAGADYDVFGEPRDVSSARQLAQDDRYQFQWWALSLVKAKPLGGSAGDKAGKKGSDKGVDGVINFLDDNTGRLKRVLVQVKSGKVKSGDLRDLAGTVQREKAEMGLLLTLEAPTRAMTTEAAAAGFYVSEAFGKKYPKLQILTVEQLLDGSAVDMPRGVATFKQAPRVTPKGSEQGGLFKGAKGG